MRHHISILPEAEDFGFRISDFGIIGAGRDDSEREAPMPAIGRIEGRERPVRKPKASCSRPATTEALMEQAVNDRPTDL